LDAYNSGYIYAAGNMIINAPLRAHS